MRYYEIIITDPDGQLVELPSSVPGSGATFTSFVNNQSLPGALQVELDIPVAAYAAPMGGAAVRVSGISLQEITTAAQLNPRYVDGEFRYFNVEVRAGMKRGLPLANAEQAGVIARGSIQQAFGNWIGTDMSMDLILAPPFGSEEDPADLTCNWQANTPLSEAITVSLNRAFPGVPTDVRISDRLVLNNDEPGFYTTLEQFASFIKQISVNTIGGTYRGVDIFFNNEGTLVVTDFTEPAQDEPLQLQFQDLIGQPTWIAGPQVQFKCPIRSDVGIGTRVRMPERGIIPIVTPGPSTALVNLEIALKGTFYVTQVRHVGSYRQPDAASWVSTFDASPEDPQPLGQEVFS